ncbi:IS256 family transposase, partial [Amycolatopsis acidiphila]|uniref:IS256 family transposase n=1 Tax=Amycolatopsis acidiphila TaxID=715473 RepID=UPI001E2FB128
AWGNRPTATPELRPRPTRLSAHFAEIYGSSVSKETISRINDKVVAEMQEWANRPLDPVYVAVFIDAIHVKVRDGQIANRPVYAAIGVTIDGHKDVLGLWMGVGGEGAKFWMSVLIDLKNRGVRDVFFLVCDGLKGLPDVVANVWPQTVVHTCIVHLIRNTFRLGPHAGPRPAGTVLGEHDFRTRIVLCGARRDRSAWPAELGIASRARHRCPAGRRHGRSPESFLSWGWRVPFLIGGVF